MPSAAKTEAVAALVKSIGEAKSVIVADYRGLTVAQVSELRAKAREASVYYKVAKNRLVKLALKECGLDTLDDLLQGPSAFAMGMEDPVSPAKVLAEFSKDNDALRIKGGLLGAEVLSADDVMKLASMPSRDELLARMLGSLQSPVTKVAIALNQTVSKIAYAISAVADQKEAEA